MKIFVLTSELSIKNGWGRYSVDMLSALSKNNVEIEVATSVYATNENAVDAVNLLPDPLRYRSNYLLAPWYAWKLKKYTTGCDAIHSFIEPYSYIAYWLGKFTGKRYFVTAHGTYAVLPYHLSGYKRFSHHVSFKGAQAIICVSEYTRARLSAYGLKNLFVINNGLIFEKFSNAAAQPAEEKDNFILSVGALKHRKGYHISIPAFAKVCPTFNTLQYYIVGNQSDHTYTESLKKLVTALSLQDRVRFVDSLSDDELMHLYKKAKLFVLTPVNEGSHFEGFGLVYLEAGACGLPVIGTSGSGVEDAIENGTTGFLVPQNDPDLTAQAMKNILQDNELSNRLSTNAVRWAKEHDWNNIIRKYVDLYNKYIKTGQYSP